MNDIGKKYFSKTTFDLLLKIIYIIQQQTNERNKTHKAIYWGSMLPKKILQSVIYDSWAGILPINVLLEEINLILFDLI